MATTNVVQFSAASRKREPNHVTEQQQSSDVIHESRTPSFGDGDGTPPIVVQVILKTQDDVFEEKKVPMKTKPVIGFWTTLIMALTFGFWLSG